MRLASIIGSIAIAFALTNSSYASLVAWYDFTNTHSSTVIDNSGNGHTGTIVGNAAFSTPNPGAPSYITNAMTFSGGSDGVNLNITGTAHRFSELTSAGTNAVSISFWAYGDNTQPDQQFAFYADDGTHTGTRAISAHTPWSDGVIYFDTAGCCGGNQRLTSPGAVSSNLYKGQWNEYTFTKDASGNKAIYIDGTLISSSTANSSIAQIADFFIGNNDSSNAGYHGQFADFAIFNSALTQTQINDLIEFGPSFFTPEPSSNVALLGLSAMGLCVGLRRYRRKRATA